MRSAPTGRPPAPCEAIRTIKGEDGTLWRYGQASYLVQKAKKERGDKQAIEEARSLLAAVAARRPTWSRVPVSQAEIDELTGNPEEAVKDYQRAIDLGERNPLVLHRAVQLLYVSAATPTLIG